MGSSQELSVSTSEKLVNPGDAGFGFWQAAFDARFQWFTLILTPWTEEGGAERCYKMALSVDPGHVHTLYNYGTFMYVPEPLVVLIGNELYVHHFLWKIYTTYSYSGHYQLIHTNNW